MSESKVGKEMAQKVAQRLMMKCDLMFDHRDYCGTGLTWNRGEFVYGKVYDGLLQQPMKTFKQEHDFVSWLAEQTNTSLAGLDEDVFYHNNQRLTLTRLFNFVNSKPTPRLS
jgi:hypothetical protein